MTDRPRLLLLQHSGEQLPPNAIDQELPLLPVEVAHVRPVVGDPLPDWRDFDGIVAMGGTMSVYEETAHPWLRAERDLIGDAVRAGTPFLGVCLGAQLLAAGLGAEVSRAPDPEVGVKQIRLNPEGIDSPLFTGFPADFESLELHRDTFSLPEGAISLADSDMYPHQAYRWKQAYGVQFHLEPSCALLSAWIDRAREQEVGPDEALAEKLMRDLGRVESVTTGLARHLIRNWLTLIDSTRRARPRIPA